MCYSNKPNATIGLNINTFDTVYCLGRFHIHGYCKRKVFIINSKCSKTKLAIKEKNLITYQM